MDHGPPTSLGPSFPQGANSLANRLEPLSFIQKPIMLEPLEGGITNHNVLVRAGNGLFVARLCQPRPHLLIDRDSEALCHTVAARRGIAPALMHREPDLLIYRWITGRSLTPADLRQPHCMTRVAELLGRLHANDDTLPAEIVRFSPLETIRAYAQTAASRAAALPLDLPSTLEDLDRLAKTLAPFQPALCHNDLLSANWIDDGTRLWLVDWEYAGLGHPLFDLANLAANAAFSDQEDQDLLATYAQQKPTDAQLADFRLLKAASYLRESLWASIQTVTATIEFDYAAYAAQNHAAYIQARSSNPDRTH